MHLSNHLVTVVFDSADENKDYTDTKLQMTFAVQIVWAVAGAFYKTSLLLLYMRLPVQLIPAPVLRRVAKVLIAVVIAFEVATVLATVLICRPIASNWDISITPQCGDKILSYRMTCVVNILTDFFILVLPFPYLTKLQMETFRKIGLVATFSLGLL